MYHRLRDLRKDHDMVQKQVAAIIGTNQRVYSTYETGVRELPLKHAITLAQFYGVSLDYLVGLTNEHEPYKPIDK